MAKAPAIEVDVGERTVRVTNPDRVYFPATGATKLDLVDYYLAVGPGIVNALRERPCMMHRFPTGVSGEKVHQKRVPAGAPPWLQTVRLHFPRYGQHADELCVTELADVIWAVQMSTVEFHPWNSRRGRHREAGRVADRPRSDAELHARHGAAGRPCRPRGARRAGRGRLAEDVRWQGDARLRAHRADVRVHGRALGGAGVRPRGRAASTGGGDDDVVAQGPRPDHGVRRLQPERPGSHDGRRLLGAGLPDGTVSTPITWDEIDDVEPEDFTMATVPRRFAELGDLHAGIDGAVFPIDELLEWAARDERAGASEDAPLPDDPD